MACPKPASERFCSPKEAGGREAGGRRSNLLSLSSRWKLGTVRINGLETQVRAVQKLPGASPNRSLWRRRLNEAQSWKRGDETAMAFTPGVRKKSRGEDAGAQDAAVGLGTRPRASGSSYPQGLLHRSRSLGRSFSKPQLRSWGFVGFFVCFRFSCCTFSALSGHKFLRDLRQRGVFPSFTHSHEP